ncbi:TlyA family RNA methyltransferase [Prochlorococcus marinus]|uniref:TlyA family rRNA (Cytidine-2'-O)-methyltransferase n=1 Tax=Prochlorococcus marinus XMU1408 TaxID=2213228 RepID=A0A318R1I7_PROMR|nr:TlyA family RNA methyltransferase [Prochlorococcus marinus]MBW3042638.1 TlyA family rRNA (cytidine-2'-O)-methyltransferase [Prochlorococcus marinus str. XMU1408]PYE01333.1 TlyA family rRNA (cytidine-2'-O)-methyltransferase [Prochlorococcus marinus XMU1408]
MTKKSRLDLHLLTKGFVKTRQEAQKLIRAGKVKTINGLILDKPGQEVLKDLEIQVTQPLRYVSRGGEKLAAAFNQFPLNINNRVCLDAGISTGGFTDCLLQSGASKVYGVDVGYGQTAWSIRNDPRVVLLERTNIRYLTPEKLFNDGDPIPDLAVADLSFISLKIVLPSIKALLHSARSELVVLVKPQFEVGKSKVGKGGVVRDHSLHAEAIKGIVNESKKYGWYPKGLIASPLKGPAGNQEYLLWMDEEAKENIEVEKFINFLEV